MAAVWLKKFATEHDSEYSGGPYRVTNATAAAAATTKANWTLSSGGGGVRIINLLEK